MSLDNVSTEQLKQEIKRREEKAKALADAERAGRAIEVICPGCNGSNEDNGYGRAVGMGLRRELPHLQRQGIHRRTQAIPQRA
jgi:hypothetical protein